MSHAIYIGRFRPFHNGHLSSIIEAFNALNLDKMTVLIGSCNRHRSPKNPFVFEEVREMIQRSLPEAIANKVVIKSLYDHSNNDVWATEVREKARGATHIVGFDKDASSFYLKMFPELKSFEPTPTQIGDGVLSASFIRDLYFREVLLHKARATTILPTGTIEVLDEWTLTEAFADIQAEYNKANEEILKFADYPYKDHLNIACADNVVTCAGHVLLGVRKNNPGKGCLAIPGGHKSEHETFFDAALRELDEETNIKVPEKVLRGSLKAEKMFDDPTRSYPHTRITMAYHIDIETDANGKFPRIKAGDDLESVHWVPLSEVRELQHKMYDDHYQIIQHFTGIY
ncbi:cytidyltransferase [Vibrio phage D484]|nr:putative nicotinamide-nucleotide adenylyltransferase / ADP compounds hydrolase [Vibrio phage 6E35.1a]